MMSREPIGGKVKRSWNIASDVAHSMRTSMRIILQNVKENRQNPAFSSPQMRSFHPIFKTPRYMDVETTELSENIARSQNKWLDHS